MNLMDIYVMLATWIYIELRDDNSIDVHGHIGEDKNGH